MSAIEEDTERLLSARFVLVVLIGLAYFASLGMLLPAVPRFVKGVLGGGEVAVGIVVGAFAFGAIIVRPFAGRLGDRCGRKVLIVVGAALVAASAALYHSAGTVPALVAVRLLGGVGEAAFFVGAGTMVTDLAPEARRGEAISYWSVAVYGGLAFGPFLGEYLVEAHGFSLAWSVSAALAALAAGVGMFATETMPPERRRSRGGPRQKLLHRASLAPGLVLFLGMVGLAGFFEFVPLYVHDIGMDDSRNVFLVYGCAILLVRILGARIPDRLGPLAAGTGATAFGAAGLVITSALSSEIGLYLGTIVFAIGMSLLYPALLTLALTGVPESERGSAVGTISSFFDASQGLGAVILGGVAAVGGYRGSFLAGAAFALVGLVLLRSGIDPRARAGIDHDAASAARESLEPDPP